MNTGVETLHCNVWNKGFGIMQHNFHTWIQQRQIVDAVKKEVANGMGVENFDTGGTQN